MLKANLATRELVRTLCLVPSLTKTNNHMIMLLCSVIMVYLTPSQMLDRTI